MRMDIGHLQLGNRQCMIWDRETNLTGKHSRPDRKRNTQKSVFGKLKYPGSK